ncbi:MAG: class I SAM-dependent methyltransferase [bacterium]|nr:class I SAM-dependent methyltransferase [bacterium]
MSNYLVDQTFLHILDTHNVTSMLDLGAGEGRQVLAAVRKGAKVFAVDKQAVLPIAATDPAVTWIQTTIEDYDIPKGAFDLIVMKNVIHFLKREFVQHSLASSIVQGLRAHGTLYISTFGQNDIVFQKSLQGYYTDEELQDIFHPIVFEDSVQEIVQDDHPPYGSHEHLLMKYIGRKA